MMAAKLAVKLDAILVAWWVHEMVGCLVVRMEVCLGNQKVYELDAKQEVEMAVMLAESKDALMVYSVAVNWHDLKAVRWAEL